MTKAYDMERVIAACEQLMAAINSAKEHNLSDWLKSYMDEASSKSEWLKAAISKEAK